MEKKMNWLALSGFMIGPILGSGVILLPPLIYNKIGDLALYGWVVILTLGMVFAMIFARLSILHPGEGGMTIAVEKVFGIKGKLLAAFALIAAVFFGPVAVLLTAAQYLTNMSVFNHWPQGLIGLLLVILGTLVLMTDIAVVAKVTLVLSTTIALVLTLSSITVLGGYGLSLGAVRDIEALSFGRSLLLLFWAIIGWEVIGNYSDEVKDRETTIRKATVVSVIAVSATYLLVVLAIQSLGHEGISMVAVLNPLFGSASEGILAVLVTGLCFATYLTFVGAAARLVHALAGEGYLPKMFLGSGHGVPMKPVLLISSANILVLVLNLSNLLDLESVVAMANGFFILNAILGLAASVKILDSPLYKLGAMALIGALTALMLLLEPISFLGYGLIAIAAFVLSTKRPSKEEIS